MNPGVMQFDLPMASNSSFNPGLSLLVASVGGKHQTKSATPGLFT
jgi:hypothetical protein